MKVTLKKDHTHAGVKYTAGSTVDVPLLDALWLKAADVVDEEIDAFKAEVRKLEGKDQQEAHAPALAKAVAADAARSKAAAAAPAPTPAPPAVSAAGTASIGASGKGADTSAPAKS